MSVRGPHMRVSVHGRSDERIGEEMMGLTRRFARMRRREHARTKMVGGKEAVRDVCIGFEREAC